MWQLTLLIYFICCAMTHVFLNERLIVIDKKTGNQLEQNTKDLISVISIIKIVYSMTWFISIPILYIKSKGYFRIAKMVRQ